MHFEPGRTVGIDLGTSYSAVAHLNRNGDPVVLRNSLGQELTGSVILFGSGGNVFVGPPDLDDADPENVVSAVKRQMGNPAYFKAFGLKQLNAEFLSALILRKMKKDAEAEIGEIGNAVVTVPYYFNDVCRKATMNAGKIAGMNVVDMVNEPTAAVLAYAWMKGELGRPDAFENEKTVLVFDLGGGTFDTTVVRYSPTHFRVLGTDGDTFLGGLDWTERLVDVAADRYVRRSGIDPRRDPRTKLKMFQACDSAKQRLSEDVSTIVTVDYQGRPLDVEVDRGRFEAATADLLQRTRDTCELVLTDSGVAPVDLDEILLVGGSTYMPAVLQMLKEITGLEPSMLVNPRLAVAQGAAVHAAILEARAQEGRGDVAEAVRSRLGNITSADVNSHSLGVEVSEPTGDRRNHVMIPRNSRLPFGVKQTFYTTRANPEGICIRLYEGEASDVDACTFVGEVRVADLPPNLPVGTPVDVLYEYDANRRIRVSAREAIGGNEAAIEFRWESGAAPQVINGLQSLMQKYNVE